MYMYICMHIRQCVYMCICRYIVCVYICEYAPIRMCVCIYIYKHTKEEIKWNDISQQIDGVHVVVHLRW